MVYSPSSRFGMLAKTWSPKNETMLNSNKIEFDNLDNQKRFFLACSRDKFELYSNNIIEVKTSTHLENGTLFFGLNFKNNTKVDIVGFKYNIRNLRGNYIVMTYL